MVLSPVKTDNLFPKVCHGTKLCGVTRLSQHFAEGVAINLVSLLFVTSQRVILLFFFFCERAMGTKTLGGTFVEKTMICVSSYSPLWHLNAPATPAVISVSLLMLII